MEQFRKPKIKFTTKKNLKFQSSFIEIKTKLSLNPQKQPLIVYLHEKTKNSIKTFSFHIHISIF